MKEECLKEAMRLIEKAMGRKAEAAEEKEYDEPEESIDEKKKPAPVITAIFGKVKKK